MPQTIDPESYAESVDESGEAKEKKNEDAEDAFEDDPDEWDGPTI